MQRLRDEAHRFGITHHRDRRSKAFLVSELEEIEGIGKITAAKLLKYFKTMKAVREASFEEIEKVMGKDKAQKIRSYFETAKA
ncbi:helix-hairpin-helix domain-containing protein [Siphonobacter sp.]|uniref:helix-hairpin-helix domain-containing protein n=1 Tax=Siphonobacter sp. TaxID=1869184 RepID=UPI003B3A134F